MTTLTSDRDDYVIRAHGLAGIDRLITDLGWQFDENIHLAGLPKNILAPELRNTRVPYRQFLATLNTCAELTGRKDFGALLSRHQDMDVIGATGDAMYQAPTFRVALEEVVKFFHLHMNGLIVIFDEANPLSLVRLEVILPNPPDYRQQVELSLGIGVRFVRRLLGAQWAPSRAYFEHPRDNFSATTEQLFACPIEYGAAFNGYSFGSKQLDIQSREFSPQTHRMMYDYLCHLAKSSDRPFATAVSETIIRALFDGNPHIDEICRRLGRSRRSLQRDLASTDHDFRSLLRGVRMELAARYLQVSSISCMDIADTLCYADSTAFSRAFTRHFGISPRKWRHGERPS